MNHYRKLIVLVGVCVVSGSVDGVSVHAADQVTRLSDGATIRGRFTKLSKNLIVLERSNGATEEFAPDEIRDLRFDREPTSLQRVRSNIRGGAFETALASVEEIRSDYGGADRRVVTELAFLQARCEAGIAQTDPSAVNGAISSLSAFAASHSNDFRSTEVNLLLARLLVEQDSGRAVGLLKQVQESGVAGFELQAGVVLGNILLKDGNAEGALQAFDDVVQRSRANSSAVSAYYDGQIGRAESLRLQGHPDQAITSLEQLISEIPDEQQQTLARAWNLIGDCQRAGKNEKAALLAYLHVDVLYAAARSEHAKSLYWLGTLWESVGHPERGVDARTRLRSQYANSKWAERSGDE